MARYFIEVSYKGTNYSGFQVQQNANSIQAEIEKVLKTFFHTDFELTGSSRTDTGVHALQNFFHVDSYILPENKILENVVYNLNAMLPDDIVIKRIYKVDENAHCRFDAKSREYKYFIYQHKDPFLADRAFYYPYKLEIEKLQEAANVILDYHDFTSFSKRNTQVKTFVCDIIKSNWQIEKETIFYNVQANRFLRGMVKGLVGTMLKVGTGKLSLNDFIQVIESKDSAKADFSVPPQALFLINVEY
jgi:tRNA pseudouridine38-40 synthase